MDRKLYILIADRVPNSIVAGNPADATFADPEQACPEEEWPNVGSRHSGALVTLDTDLTLDPPSATSDEAGAPLLDVDYLILSTIHSAKGQEWKV